MYEACIWSVIKALREGRRGGAKDFYITGDINVELGMMCTDEKDIEELEGIYGPLRWQGYDKDPRGFKKMMLDGIMEELNCKATSTWSKCGRAKETALTHKHLSPESEEETSHLDYLIGPRRRDDDVYICNDVWTLQRGITITISARIQDEERTKKTFRKEREEVNIWSNVAWNQGRKRGEKKTAD